MFYSFKTKFTFKIDKGYHSYRIRVRKAQNQKGPYQKGPIPERPIPERPIPERHNII